MRRFRAFKFKPSSQFDYALDIIFNRRLYCADWATLNDPMEGRFVFCYSGGDPKDRIAEIIREKKQLRVCSLSRTYSEHLVWAHYAAGFDGLAVEVQLPGFSRTIKKVFYERQLYPVEYGEDFNAGSEAESVLTRKFRAWRYEREVRIVQRERWFDLDRPVVRVIAGHRMKPALMRALTIICRDQSIELRQTRISDVSIELGPAS